MTPLRQSLLQQRGHLFCWVPVFLALGIGLYFKLPVEPPAVVLGAATLLGCALVLWARTRDFHVKMIATALAVLCFGLALGGTRAWHVGGPVLDFRYYGPIEGRVAAIDRSASDAVRLTLTEVRLLRVSPEDTPRRVRVSLHGQEQGAKVRPGDVIGITGHLSPPSGPVEPGGFDFQRHAWFLKIGAVGYTRVPVVRLATRSSYGRINGFRMNLSEAIQARMPSDVAGFGAAVTTGDRSGIPQATTEALRGANLAHLLAISGLHMGLLVGFVFGALRAAIALFPTVALRVNGKSIAACGAFVASVGYLLLSGGSVSTQRAFVMTTVVLLAVLLDRRALTMRAVAVAAIVVLLMRPEALMGPGFQMSFAATAALVGVFGWIRDMEWRMGPKWLRPVSAVVVSSLVAGLATAPFAALHFNHVAHFGLLANVLSVPIMGTVVVPAAVVAACLAPIGLENLPLWFMEQGLRWILTVATFVSGLDGARGMVPAGSAWVLPLISLGGIWVLLWQSPARLFGVVVMLIGYGIWSQSERPDILISDTGGLVGVMTENGRALSKSRGQGFVAQNWLENDGTSLDQLSAAALWPRSVDKAPMFDLGPRGKLIHVQGKTGFAQFTDCAEGDLVVFSVVYEGNLPCATLDLKALQRTGSVALQFNKGGVTQKTARETAGRRLWNDPEIRGQ